MYNANFEEQKILEFWDKDKTFEKSVSERSEKKPYVFYDGPPFATGLPHYGHILSSVIKDVVPRYWTMKGYRVRRRWGWDCHGLPIENLVEKELKISGKKEIDGWGIEKFNEACRFKVLLYTQEWKKMVERIGRWVEFDTAYKTMDSSYMESVWWSLKTIWEKGLIYEGRKVLMYCPRCETPVSKAEIAMDNSYKDITEESVTVKFKIKNPKKHGLPENTYILAWTTTPWTLPGNVALAVGKGIGYLILDIGGENVILAKERVAAVSGDKQYTVIKEIKGSDLVGLEYEPLFDLPAVKSAGKKGYYVATADFVTTDDGTSVVHTAVIYGEDDYNLGVKLDLPMVPMLNEKGEFNDVAPEFLRGKYFKQAEKDIKKDLDARGLLFAREQFTHSYPHCWRCDTQLFYNAISAWFIDIQKVKPRLIELNKKINWYPEHLKNGRFLNILETAPDWNISRNRYWATPLPFWKCEDKKCAGVVCIGSVAELKKQALNFSEVFSTDTVEKIDLHKHIVDQIKLKCDHCGGVMARIPEVIDCWVESASMPFAEFHYPFENKKTFQERHPGQYIAEYIAQTRAWFYYMHAMAVLLFDDASFKNCVTTGTILNEKGEKLSKSKQNYPDPWKVIEQYGVDSLRYYLMTSVVMEADDLFFNEREVREVYNKVVNMLWNVVTFYQLYAGNVILNGVKDPLNSDKSDSSRQRRAGAPLRMANNVLDRWILAKLQVLIREVTENMDKYNTIKAGRPIKDFIDELSTWYVRRSRDRFKGDDASDAAVAVTTLREVLTTLSKLMAPFMPFIAEKVFQEVTGKMTSVHLEMWPKAGKADSKIITEMEQVRKIVELGLALRAEAGVKVRQVLGGVATSAKLSQDLQQIVADELNVKQVLAKQSAVGKWQTKEDSKLSVSLNAEITAALKKEGLIREIIRTINQIRKEQGLTISDKVVVRYHTGDTLLASVFKDFASEIQSSVLATKLEKSAGSSLSEVAIDNRAVRLQVVKL
ncbi:MAG: isoleucine--tRNA ligase [Candidatus Magasanikbacteria bacterium]|nr:isoleucine--tRNA ligase [Candidatus Magasanikbacteria bacterium]